MHSEQVIRGYRLRNSWILFGMDLVCILGSSLCYGDLFDELDGFILLQLFLKFFDEVWMVDVYVFRLPLKNRIRTIL
jgi:hypothetical protein